MYYSVFFEHTTFLKKKSSRFHFGELVENHEPIVNQKTRVYLVVLVVVSFVIINNVKHLNMIYTYYYGVCNSNRVDRNRKECKFVVYNITHSVFVVHRVMTG